MEYKGYMYLSFNYQLPNSFIDELQSNKLNRVPNRVENPYSNFQVLSRKSLSN